MVKGGILYYALLVLMLSSLILGSIILIGYYQHIRLVEKVTKDRIISEVESAIKLAVYSEGYYDNEGNDHFQVFPEDTFRVKLGVRPWGAFSVISASSTWKKFSYSQNALIGIDPFSHERIALYLADGGRGISISGSTKIKGNCYLPGKSIRAASIEGQPFSGKKLTNGTIKPSKPKLPNLKSNIFDFAKLAGSDLSENKFNSIIHQSSFYESIQNSFDYKPTLVYSDGPMIISHSSIKGNIILYSGHSIRLDSTCTTEDIILISPSIIVNSGFKGCFQAFSDQSIQVGERCQLYLPTILAVASPVSGYMGPKSISIGSGSMVHGTVIIKEHTGAVSMVINNKSKIFGQVYCPGQVTLKGDIIGSLYCLSFYLKTNRAQYVNHLLNNTIDPTNLSTHFVGSGVLATDNEKKIAKWLN